MPRKKWTLTEVTVSRDLIKWSDSNNGIVAGSFSLAFVRLSQPMFPEALPPRNICVVCFNPECLKWHQTGEKVFAAHDGKKKLRALYCDERCAKQAHMNAKIAVRTDKEMKSKRPKRFLP